MSCTDPPLYPNKPLEYRIQPDFLIKLTTNSPRFVLGYWSIRGMGAPLRMMLCAARVPHWVALYHVKATPGVILWDKESWHKDKAWMEQANPFANLPYLIDTKTQTIICQTNAIFSYLGKELNMIGSNKMETAKCEELLCEIYDLRNVMVDFAYGNDQTSATKNYAAIECLQRGAVYLSKLETYLQQQQSAGTAGYLVGNALTAPDFHLYEMYCQFDSLSKYYSMDESLDEMFPLLKAHVQAFQSLKENQMYLNSPELYQNLPFNNPYAHFGADPKTNGGYERGKGVSKQEGKILLVYDIKDYLLDL
mmetsp:Transcript_17524/g.25931  ORF Transcript_17524/g.25931 Transcript_17524/m.25931 type:complete len:307 (-) Transcript_17524:165-1085(-)|eukprot:CAMPEP_0194212502 /NCGR_PEP_ID=MMETSP0156-20130528/12473_1 /TAXON_ID=33649 /ORGANISM="Thalassionema nitzschioides, Strain L26-B" /LENGTH=306 /DNA_ID=CAMNT_0038940347 /DNA_START=115 /DNA_END=1035 /DNA_ORIENTATION=+